MHSYFTSGKLEAARLEQLFLRSNFTSVTFTFSFCTPEIKKDNTNLTEGERVSGRRCVSHLLAAVHGQAGAGHPKLEQEDDEEDDHVLGGHLIKS